jgi:hypothetical protein
MDEYPITLLRALEDWLNHDPDRRLSRAQTLRAELLNVEPSFKQCSVPCYRRIDFPKDPSENPRGVPLPLLDLLHTGKLKESISSWTTDPDVAKAHLEGVQPDATCVIFKHVPSPTEVWLDLSALLHAPAFQRALQGASFPAIQSWMNRESEVILEVEHVTPEEVYAWGSFAGDADQLREAAVREGKSPEEITAHEADFQRLAGQERWLSEERSKAVALKMTAIARQRFTHPPPESALKN